MDSHPLVKSLKMCPFPNRASEMDGSNSKLHVQSQQEAQTCPVQAALGPQGILGPESSCKRSVKNQQTARRMGVETHVRSLNLLRLRSENTERIFLLRRDPASKESPAQGIPEDKWGGVPGARAVAVIAPWVGAQVDSPLQLRARLGLCSFSSFGGGREKEEVRPQTGVGV